MSQRRIAIAMILLAVASSIIVAKPLVLLGQQQPALRSAQPQQLKGLIVGNESKGRYEWSRDSAIEFGMTQLSKLIDYVFVATMAMLGLVVKTLVFDRINIKPDDAPPVLTRFERNLSIGIITLLSLSAVFGLLAYGTLPQLITEETFSLNDPVGYFVLCQYVTSGIGVLLIGWFCIHRVWS